MKLSDSKLAKYKFLLSNISFRKFDLFGREDLGSPSYLITKLALSVEYERVGWIAEMMVMVLGETCWNNEGGYH
jgi:hypothetical protein